MDRRMYRNQMGNMNARNSNCNYTPYRTYEPMSGNMSDGCMQEERGAMTVCYDDCFTNNKNCPIGMCYVPWQCFRNLYENEYVALQNGNLFKELQFDWYGRGCK